MTTLKSGLILLTMISMLSILSCAKPNYYKSNGVYYYEKPQKELAGYIKINTANEITTSISDGIVVDSLLYIATKSNIGIDPNKTSKITLYAIDTNSYVIRDSLIFSEKNGISDLFPTHIGGYLYFISTQWKGDKGSLYILKTDTKLKQAQPYYYDIPGYNIEGTAVVNNTLVVLMKLENKERHIIQIDANSMKEKTSYPISKDALSACFDNEKIYVISRPDSNHINITSRSLANPATIIDTTSFQYQIKTTVTEHQKYLSYFNGDDGYFIYRKSLLISEKGEGTITVVKFNLKSHQLLSGDFPAYTFDILNIDGTDLLYKTDFKPSYKKRLNYSVPVLSELDKTLKTEKELISFLPSEWNYGFYIVPAGNSRVAMLGVYQTISEKTNVQYNSPFIAFYDLK